MNTITQVTNKSPGTIVGMAPDSKQRDDTMKTKRTTKKGDASTRELNLFVSERLRRVPEETVQLLLLHHSAVRFEVRPGLFVTRYHFESGHPSIQPEYPSIEVTSNEDLTEIIVAAIIDPREPMDTEH